MRGIDGFSGSQDTPHDVQPGVSGREWGEPHFCKVRGGSIRQRQDLAGIEDVVGVEHGLEAAHEV